MQKPSQIDVKITQKNIYLLLADIAITVVLNEDLCRFLKQLPYINAECLL